MCDPVTIGITSLALGVIGTGAGIYSSYQEGKTQQSYYNYQAELNKRNAQIAEENAAVERQGGIEDARLQRIKTIQAIGSQQSALAANGIDVTSGTSLDVIEDTAAMGELDALNILTQSERNARNYLTQSDNYNSQAYLNTLAGKNAYKTGIYSAIGSGISGIGSTVMGLGNLDKVSSSWKKITKL